MKILLFGAGGQVGWELQRSLAPLGELTALGRSGQPGLCGDLVDLSGLAETVKAVAPDVIVNAAAYTAVDKAEAELDLARTINAAGPAILAREAKSRGALLVHYSTDYVFDGAGREPWQEDDMPRPVNAYGQTKLEGELAIRESGCRYLILRTSWVYAARGHNFLHTMLRLAGEREALNVVADQIGAPTGAELIADITAHLVASAARDAALGGIYHLAAQGETSWCDYARFIVDAAGRAGASLKVAPESIHPVPSSEYPTPALRPRNSRLSTEKLERTFALRLPPWERGVQRALVEILSAQAVGGGKA